MLHRFTWWALSGLALLALVAWFLATRAYSSMTTADASAPRAEPAAARSAHQAETGPSETLGVAFQTLLLPDQEIAAQPNSVRIGLAYVAPDDAQAFQESSNGELKGAAPGSFAELATVERFVTVPAQKLADGSVQVGPLNLPRADRYDLQARGESPLHFYVASFTAENYPASIKPTLAAGLKILRESAPDSDVRVLLRRTSATADAALWYALMQNEAPQLIAALGETSLAVAPVQILTPLPPGTMDVLLEVDGILAERQSVALVAGALAELRLDPVKQAVAQAVSVTLQLSFVVEDNGQPVQDLAVSWVDHDAAPARTSDASGTVSFRGMDRQQSHRFNVQFPAADSASDSALPKWPTQKAIEVDLGKEPGSDTARVIRKTIELRPLQYLIVRTGALQVSTQRTVGNPYPVFVLQQLRAGRWIDAASEYFIPVPEGIAVSVEEAGQFRVAALQSAWSISYSTAVDVSESSSDGKHRAELIPDAGRATELTLRRDGIPIVNTQFALSAPIGGLPASMLTTDNLGRVQLAAVTVPSVRIEVPGFAVAEVNLGSVIATVDLLPESVLPER